ETGSRTAVIEACTHKYSTPDRAENTRVFLVTGNRFVNATLIVSVAAKVSAFSCDLLRFSEPRVLVARYPINSRDHCAHDEPHDDEQDNQQSFKPTWHGETSFFCSLSHWERARVRA